MLLHDQGALGLGLPCRSHVFHSHKMLFDPSHVNAPLHPVRANPRKGLCRKREARRGVRGNVMFPPNRCQCFQVTHLQVADLQWDATGTVFGLMPSKSALSLAPYSRPACGVLTIYTNPPPAFTRSLRSAASFQRLLPSRQTPRHETEECGVATSLAAIQGLYQVVEEKDTRIRAFEARLQSRECQLESQFTAARKEPARRTSRLLSAGSPRRQYRPVSVLTFDTRQQRPEGEAERFTRAAPRTSGRVKNQLSV